MTSSGLLMYSLCINGPAADWFTDHQQMNLNQSGHALLTRENHLCAQRKFDFNAVRTISGLIKQTVFERKNIAIVIKWKTQGKHLDLSWEKARSISTSRRYKESTFLSSYEKRNSNIIHLNCVSPNEQN